MSRVRVSVRRSNVFIREKHQTYRGNRVASACGYLNSQRSALSQAERTVTVGRHRIAIACAADGDGGYGGYGGDGFVCASVCARACARVCARACVCTRVRVGMRDVFAIYDNIFDPG